MSPAVENESGDGTVEPGSELPGGDGTPIDFSTFVLSISTSCMIQLGELPSPDGHKHMDLGSARDSIEILQMLEERTAGNLTGDECRLLSHVLNDVRQRYVARYQASPLK